MSTAGLLALAAVPSLTCPAILLGYRRRRKIKRDDIRRLTQSEAVRKTYAGADGPASPETVFQRTTSWSSYLVPVALYIVTTTLFVAALLLPGFLNPPEWLKLILARIDNATLAGFAGSFLWSHYDLVRRFTTYDLPPTAIYQMWLRLVGGALAGPALATALDPAFKAPFAFAIGALPLTAIRTAAQRFSRKRLELPEGEVREPPTLHFLQGTTEPTMERLAEEGITSTQHLALADPLRLFLRTNLELTVILDLVDQAALHLYVGDKLPALRAVGLRSAIEVAEIRDYLDSDNAVDQTRGQELIDLAAKVLATDDSAVRKIVDSLYDDPQVSFVWELWLEAFGDSENGEAQDPAATARVGAAA